ncbi:hypothetical protein [Actinacidiphila alni]|uniref:hypothetical protein n=1 Tax=Actinacidiphila alni TaxID=380248 RepID=UPI0011609CD9|nr:hypothetical protein [Actinacidiphila alni]
MPAFPWRSAPRYRISILRDDESPRERAVTGWSEVRAFVGDAVEDALGDFEEAQQQAYELDVPRLRQALLDPMTRVTIETSGSWRMTLDTVPLTLVITARSLRGRRRKGLWNGAILRRKPAR